MSGPMHDVSSDRETVVPSRGSEHPSPGRRLRAIASLVLVLAVSLTHQMPVAEINAEASGPGWEVTHDSNRLVTGWSLRASDRTVNDPPREVERQLDELSSLGGPLLGGALEIVVFFGAVLAVRWRRGAFYGLIASIAWLGAILAVQRNLQSQVDAVAWPGSLDLDFLPALGGIIAAHIALVIWFVIRWVLDRREDRQLVT
jgi:hypothetical protein